MTIPANAARNTFRRTALALAALPLALGLAACGKEETGPASLSGDKIAPIAAPAGKVWGDVVEKTADGGYRMGNPDAPIKIIEFASLTCSHCADFSGEASAELRDTFVGSGRVSYELRNFVRDAIDITAAQLTRCGTPESYFPLTEQVFAAQADIFAKVQGAGEAAYKAAMAQPDDKRGMAVAELAGLTEFFAARGISRDQASACLANTADAAALAKMANDQGEKFDITGTPTFVLNGAKIDENSWKMLKAKLETLGAR
ncbi:MAG: thioredoxin domain-containing protein [Novosphingobium sp.]